MYDLPSKGLNGLCPALALQDAYDEMPKAATKDIRSTRLGDVTALSSKSAYSLKESKEYKDYLQVLKRVFFRNCILVSIFETHTRILGKDS